MPESGSPAQQAAGPGAMDAGQVAREAAERLGPAEADAFLARLEQLSFDITGPLSQLYGDVVDVGSFATGLVLWLI